MTTSENSFFGRFAALRGARFLAYLNGMSRSLCSVRLALHPENLNLLEVSYEN
jgi:hypothetical protein